MRGLNGHIKIHSEKRFECPECTFKGTSVNTFNAHMKTHLGEEICAASQSNKRDLSISPEINKDSRQKRLKDYNKTINCV